MLNIGDKIPQFEALDADGNPICSDDLLGTLAVIYFYPKDDTPGCTKEACEFRDSMNVLDDKGVLVLGVSPDSARSHQAFSRKYNLNFSLITDENKEICKKFGVLKEREKDGTTLLSLERTTFIVDENGIVNWIERPVNVEGHVSRIVKIIENLERLHH